MEVVNHMATGRDRMYSLSRDRRGAYGRAIVGYFARKSISDPADENRHQMG